MSLRKNISYNVFYQIAHILIPLLTTPYISRTIGTDGVGVYAYSTSVANYFALFMLLGVGNYGSRSIAMARGNKGDISKVFCEIYYLQLISSAVVAAAYFLYVLPFGGEYKIPLMIQGIFIISAFMDVSWYFVGTEQFKVTAVSGAVTMAVEAVCIFGCVNASADLYLYIAIMTCGTLCSRAVLFFITARQITFTKVTVKDMVRHIKPNLVLFAPLLAASVFTLMDKIMLEYINHDLTDVGIYDYSEKIVRIPLTVISSIGTVMMPKVAFLVASGKQRTFESYMKASMRYVGLAAAAFAFGLAAIAPEFSVIFYGEEFSACGALIPVLTAIIIFSAFANVIRTQYLIPQKLDREYVISIVLGAVINLLLNTLLIPRYGSTGAAIGTIGAEFGILVGHLIGIRGKLKVGSFMKEWTVFLGMGAVMYGIVRILGNAMNIQVITLLAEILVGAVIFLLLAGMYLLCKKDTLVEKAIKLRRNRT